jgi:hypothetical protein
MTETFKENGKQQKHINKMYVTDLTARLLSYYSDPNKKGRQESGLCKCCAYVNTGRIGGTAITHHNCDNCGVEMHFGNTCTDKLCRKCAVEIQHCKHCGQKLD